MDSPREGEMEARKALATLVCAAASLAGAAPAAALDDGFGRTPPMGFNNWNATHCGADFNEAMVKGMADLFVSSGLKDAGYQYVNLDDCWARPQRDAMGKLVPDPARFPNGIKAVADYVHSKGLKLGIYTSAGTKTCNSAGLPARAAAHESRARRPGAGGRGRGSLPPLCLAAGGANPQQPPPRQHAAPPA